MTDLVGSGEGVWSRVRWPGSRTYRSLDVLWLSIF